MPLYRDKVARELERSKAEFSDPEDRKRAVEAYRTASEDIHERSTKGEIEVRLGEYEQPGALPTGEFDEFDDLCVPFGQTWESHEAVNEWARECLEDRAVIAADGSQIDPVREFDRPVGLVQALWLVNHHSNKREFERDVEVEILTPEDLLMDDSDSGYMRVDTEEVAVARFELEMQVLGELIEEYSDVEPTPVAMYDGPLTLSFAQMFDQERRDRYAEALSKVLAASECHEVPFVGFTSGSKAGDIGTMLDRLGEISVSQKVQDFRMLLPYVENWGDRSQLYVCRRDSSLDWLSTSYRGETYDFSEDIAFCYMNTGSGFALDRVDMPRWIIDSGFSEEVLRVVRADAAVGRGYPEILSAADTDAVISREDREYFLDMYQDFAEENDIQLRWMDKALSKKRRRR
jgi:hypothetical protein